MTSPTQYAIIARVVASGRLFHPGPKAEALAEFTRQLWMILRGQEEGFRQLHIQYSGSKSHGTGMEEDTDYIIKDALAMARVKMPERGRVCIGYQLQLSGPEAAPPESKPELGGEDVE